MATIFDHMDKGDVHEELLECKAFLEAKCRGLDHEAQAYWKSVFVSKVYSLIDILDRELEEEDQ